MDVMKLIPVIPKIQGGTLTKQLHATWSPILASLDILEGKYLRFVPPFSVVIPRGIDPATYITADRELIDDYFPYICFRVVNKYPHPRMEGRYSLIQVCFRKGFEKNENSDLDSRMPVFYRAVEAWAALSTWCTALRGENPESFLDFLYNTKIVANAHFGFVGGFNALNEMERALETDFEGYSSRDS